VAGSGVVGKRYEMDMDTMGRGGIAHIRGFWGNGNGNTLNFLGKRAFVVIIF